MTPSAGPKDWTFKVLPNPPRRKRCRAFGFWEGVPFGSAEGPRGGAGVATIWEETGPREIEVKGYQLLSLASGNHGPEAAGSAMIKDVRHALILRKAGSGFEAVDLHEDRYDFTGARFSDGKRQIGNGKPKGRGSQAALEWSGTAVSVKELPNSPEPDEVEAKAMDKGLVVGRMKWNHAGYWPKGGGAPVDLNPPKMEGSLVEAVAEGDMVGTGWMTMERMVPVLWRENSPEGIVLTPSGFHSGAGLAAAGGFQAGRVARENEPNRSEAALWAGGPETFVNLQDKVTAKGFNSSCILAMKVENAVLTLVGEVCLVEGNTTPSVQAALWQARL